MIFTEVVRADVIQGFSLRFCFLFEIAFTGQNVSSSFPIVCRNELFVSSVAISRVLLQVQFEFFSDFQLFIFF